MKSSRKIPTQARSRATVDALLDATIQVICDLGYEQTTTQRIARRAGTSIGSLYQYFPDKDALLCEVVRRFTDEYQSISEQVLLEASRSSPCNAVRKVVKLAFDRRRQEPEFYKRIRPYAGQLGMQEVLESQINALVTFVSMLYNQWSNELTLRNTEQAAFLSVHAVSGILDATTCKRPELLTAEFEEEVSQMLFRYLGLEDTDTKEIPLPK